MSTNAAGEKHVVSTIWVHVALPLCVTTAILPADVLQEALSAHTHQAMPSATSQHLEDG